MFPNQATAVQAPAPLETEIQSQRRLLQQATEETEALVKQLDARLIPILHPIPTSKGNGIAGSNISSIQQTELGQFLGSRVSAAEGMNGVLRSIIDRLAL